MTDRQTEYGDQQFASEHPGQRFKRIEARSRHATFPQHEHEDPMHQAEHSVVHHEERNERDTSRIEMPGAPLRHRQLGYVVDAEHHILRPAPAG